MANKTALQEAAQALFCSLADYLGERETNKVFDKSTYKTYDDFVRKYDPPGNKNITQIIKESFKSNVNAPGVSLEDIETFLSSDKSWFHSSMNIAKKVLSEVETINKKFNRIKNVKWSNIVYVRGDEEVMGNIQTLFSRANKILKEIEGSGKAFGNINKWSPADIYFATDKAKTKLAAAVTKNKKITFEELNGMIAGLIESADLLPLSLKKQAGDVTVVKVNFEEKGALPYIFAGIGGREEDARSLIVKLSKTDAKTDMVVRHDASTGTFSGGTYKLEIRVKGGARGGSLSGNKIIDTIKVVDPQFGAQFELSLQNAKTGFGEGATKKLKGLNKEPKDSPEGKRYRAIRDDLSKKYFTDSGPNKDLKDYLLKNERNEKSTKLIKAFVVAAASGSDYSGKYIIAK